MRIAILSNVTVEVLAKMLEGHEVWTPSGFGAWVQTALEPPPEMKAFAPEAVYILFDSAHAAANDEKEMLPDAVESLKRAFPKTPVIVPDVDALAREFGASFYDERMWQYAKMPWSIAALRRMSRLFGAKKVLALDLDGVLWQGVISEDGISGIRPDVDFQHRVKELRNRGVLLTILSKNRVEDVEGVWDDPRMVLKRDDFVKVSIDWNAKAENLLRQAKELNLSPDSFVFVDDNPGERARMREQVPEVCVDVFPPNPEILFPMIGATAEDLMRTSFYFDEEKRRNAVSAGEYLDSLDIHVDVHQMRDGEVERVAQLSEKVNQFNVLTNRYTVADVRAFAANVSRLIFTASAGDRFGDMGLVAFVQVKKDGETAEILDWVMSCRAMNRQIEFTVEKVVEAELAKIGVTRLLSSWRRTAKNLPVETLFDSFGFVPVQNDGDFKRYERSF